MNANFSFPSLSKVFLSFSLAVFFNSGILAYSQIKVTNVFNARILGGQYFFENQESNLSGNVGFTAAPAVTFNKQWSIVPRLSASWRGTKSVRDLVGGGTLFQQTQDHAVGLKGVYTLNNVWQFKAGSGYQLQLLKETNDESWGKGLYDYQKPNVNVECERTLYKDSSLRFGYDFYWIDFRNFSTLESEQRDLGRENASAKTLNTSNHAPYVTISLPFPFIKNLKAQFNASYYPTMRRFSEQKIVLLTGDLSTDLRNDVNHIVSADATLPYEINGNLKLLTELSGGINMLKSAQNNYDARLTRFNPNYYSYTDYNAGAKFNFIIGKGPLIVSPGFNYSRRNYSERPMQNTIGSYESERIQVNEYYAGLALTYPLQKNFKIQFLGNLGWSRSNMKYEKTYRYNYTTSAYLLGVVFDY